MRDALLRRAVQCTELSGQHAAAVVELDRHLPGVDAELGRRGRIENVLDLLQLKEMGARADAPKRRRLI